MSTNDIIIKKESDGEVINMFDQYYSSDESSIEVAKHSKAPTTRKTMVKKRPVVVSNKPNEQQPPPPPPPATTPVVPDDIPTLKDDMFEVFTNPDKKRVVEESEDSFGGDDPFEQRSTEQNFYQPQQQTPTNYAQTYSDDEEYPTEGFNSVEEEKQDYLYKFYRLQSKGVPVQKKFNINSNVSEMRAEYNRIKRDAEVNSSIRFSRRMLMACVTAVEFMNTRYDPFDIKLDGWSESVMQNVDDYDNVFERLHDKYASKVAMAPEIELMLSLAGSAFMFHLTNSMFNSMPNLKDIAKQNPDILKNMMQSMSAAAANHTPKQPPTDEPAPPPSGTNNNGFREMKGPMFDMSNLMGMMQPPVEPKPITNLRPIGNEAFEKKDTSMNDSPSEISSDVDDIYVNHNKSQTPQTKHISFSETTSATSSKRRGRNKIQSTSENTITI